MADTGNPWFIPFAEPSDLVRDWPALSSAVGTAVAAALTVANNFTAGTAITATNASWPVPALANPVVKVTVIGGGGGGGGGNNTGVVNNGATGGTSTFNAGGAGTVTASGGVGGVRGAGTSTSTAGSAGFSAGNGGQGGNVPDDGGSRSMGGEGNGGRITVSYLNLTGISTVNVTVGAGGAGGSSQFASPGAAGGRGEVIVEYAAG